MGDLSPAAQAVMAAATMGNENCQADPVYRQCIAAALRAAADQMHRGKARLDAIAAELEGANA